MWQLLLCINAGSSAQLSSVKCGPTPSVKLFLPMYAFYSPRNYNFTGVLWSTTFLNLSAGQTPCNTATWPRSLRGRTIFLTAAIATVCTSSEHHVEEIYKNISEMGASSVTYFPFPASGYFALRRFSFNPHVFSYSTPHVVVGTEEVAAIMSPCAVAGRPSLPVLNLVPEQDTHIQIYEDTGWILSWFLFLFSFVLLGYTVHVARRATDALGTMLTVTHFALSLGIAQVLSNSVLLGPWGLVSFSYILTSKLSLSWPILTDLFYPVKLIVLVFRLVSVLWARQPERSKMVAYYAVCMAICTTMVVIMVNAEAEYRNSTIDDAKLQKLRWSFSSCRIIALSLYAGAFGWLVYVWRKTWLNVHHVVPRPAILHILQALAISTFLQIGLGSVGSVLAHYFVEYTTGNVLLVTPASPKNHYMSWWVGGVVLYLCDELCVLLEVYTFHLAIVVRRSVSMKRQETVSFAETTMRDSSFSRRLSAYSSPFATIFTSSYRMTGMFSSNRITRGVSMMNRSGRFGPTPSVDVQTGTSARFSAHQHMTSIPSESSMKEESSTTDSSSPAVPIPLARCHSGHL